MSTEDAKLFYYQARISHLEAALRDVRSMANDTYHRQGESYLPGSERTALRDIIEITKQALA